MPGGRRGGQEVDGQALYFPLNIPVKLKLLKKIKSIKKQKKMPGPSLSGVRDRHSLESSWGLTHAHPRKRPTPKGTLVPGLRVERTLWPLIPKEPAQALLQGLLGPG